MTSDGQWVLISKEIHGVFLNLKGTLGTSLGKISICLNKKETLGPWLGKETVGLKKKRDIEVLVLKGTVLV